MLKNNSIVKYKQKTIHINKNGSNSFVIVHNSTTFVNIRKSTLAVQGFNFCTKSTNNPIYGVNACYQFGCIHCCGGDLSSDLCVVREDPSGHNNNMFLSLRRIMQTYILWVLLH